MLDGRDSFADLGVILLLALVLALAVGLLSEPIDTFIITGRLP